jgi:hypothetical protein
MMDMNRGFAWRLECMMNGMGYFACFGEQLSFFAVL